MVAYTMSVNIIVSSAVNETVRKETF